MKTLILCRHAKSDWPEGIPDIRRPLKERGVRDANFLGDLLRGQAFRPDRMVTSPAMRARQTAEIIATCISYPGELTEAQEIYYEGEIALMRYIRSLSNDWETVMIFGHNPTLEDTVRNLLGSEAPFFLPTSAMVCLESMTSSWQHFVPRNLHMRWMLIPRLKRRH